MRKIAFCALFLILLFNSSCSPQCQQWKIAVIKSNCPCATYTKVYLPTNNAFNGIDAVFISCNGSVRLYFNALTFLFVPFDDNPECSQVTLKINDQAHTFIAERLEGGQSLLLSEESTQLIVEALLEQTSVDVTAGRYQTILIPDNFEKTYRALW